MIYTYDATFFGFLSAVFDGWHDGITQIEDIRAVSAPSLFGGEQLVQTEEQRPAGFWTVYRNNAVLKRLTFCTMRF